MLTSYLEKYWTDFEQTYTTMMHYGGGVQHDSRQVTPGEQK